MAKAATNKNSSNKTWTAEEREYLENAWGNTPIKVIAAHLGRSVAAINNKVYKYGLGKFLENGVCKNYVSKHQLSRLLGLTGGDSYKNTLWIKDRQLPTHKIIRLNATFNVIFIDEFWKWAEKNQSILDFSRFQKYALGPEPEWVDAKRRRDVKHKREYKTTPWSKQEDERLSFLLKQHRFSYIDLSKMLQRTTGAIQRRVIDLNLKERPVKADNHIYWTDDECDVLTQMIKDGCRYEEMQDALNKSSKAIRGRVFNMYLTERLDKVREYIGDGKWGDGQPMKPLRYKHLMRGDEKDTANTKLSEFAGILLEIAKSKSGVSEEYREYFQKDMCKNWNDVEGCTKGEKSCDTCNMFQRIQPQYCVRCGATFFERKENKICASCRKARIYQHCKKQNYLYTRGKG